MSKEKISVIMSVYREPIEWLSKAINSILEQDYPNLEFIIIVDNPEDKTLHGYIKKREEEDSRIRVLFNDKNIGLPESLNRGIKAAKGDYIARMDADDISKKNRLSLELKYLLSNQLDLVAANITDIDEEGKITNSSSCYPTTDFVIKKYLRYGSSMPHPTWLGRKEIFKNTEGYKNFLAAQDYEFLTRVSLQGYKLGVVKQPCLYYRINSKSISSEKKDLQKTILFYIRKNYRNEKVVDIDEWNEFIESTEGKNKVASLHNYYMKSATLKKALRQKKYFSFGIGMIHLLLISEEARSLCRNLVGIFLLKLRYRKYF